ncbi:hypothetical protein SAMN05216167_1355 [Spirosoma endophyticum]|uniref:Uncharacterized protein n=2 Tax=Spirosoma endophyticum TaxID=662367 RepID=A0A1I2GQR8_9BACT|nr:hypothetical protein SAMN05216167_1355 [Spirosoma endophyticum]
MVTVIAVSGSCLAQTANYDVTIIADGKALDLSQGIPASTKTIELTGQRTQKDLQQDSQLKPDVLIQKATLTLARDTKKICAINWPGKASIANLFKEAKVGDRLMIQFEDVELQTKQGQTQKIDDSKLVQLTIKE